MKSYMTFACYMLKSKNPNFPRTSYIGFTHNLFKRYREHNGEIVRGAKQTQKARPWEMIISMAGFQDKVTGLRFEWAWQHPFSSNLFLSSELVNKKRRQELSCATQDQKNLSLDFRMKVLLELLQSSKFKDESLIVNVYKKKIWEYYYAEFVPRENIKMKLVSFSKHFYRMKKKIRKKTGSAIETIEQDELIIENVDKVKISYMKLTPAESEQSQKPRAFKEKISKLKLKQKKNQIVDEVPLTNQVELQKAEDVQDVGTKGSLKEKKKRENETKDVGKEDDITNVKVKTKDEAKRTKAPAKKVQKDFEVKIIEIEK